MSSTALWYTTRATGIVALVLFTGTVVLGIATTNRAKARNWPGFAQQEIHRRISLMAVVFLGIHVLTSVLDTYVSIGWAAVLVPFTSSYGRFWVATGTVSLDLMLAVLVSSLLRSRMRPGVWRAVHWLAYLAWPIALAHTFGMGSDAREPWLVMLGAVCVLSVGAALLWRILVQTHQRRIAATASPAVGACTHLAVRGPARGGRAVRGPARGI